MSDKLNSLQKKINIKFKNLNYLKKSITHKSYDQSNNYEKLEFLGDRVLGLVIAKKLLEIYPNEKEGILDKKFASLVNKKTCLEIAKKIELHKYILSLNTKNTKNIIVDKVLADCCEALIGSVYLDNGFNSVEKVILNLWSNHIKNSIVTKIDPKTKLQEFSLKKFKSLPVYKIISNTGPKHKPVFKVGVKIKNTNFIFSSGTSKKNAEQSAASILLKNLDLK